MEDGTVELSSLTESGLDSLKQQLESANRELTELRRQANDAKEQLSALRVLAVIEAARPFVIARYDELVKTAGYGAACELAFGAELLRPPRGESGLALAPGRAAEAFSRAAAHLIDRVTDSKEKIRDLAWAFHGIISSDLPPLGPVGSRLLRWSEDPSTVPTELQNEFKSIYSDLKKPDLIPVVVLALESSRFDGYAFFWHLSPLVSLAACQAFIEGSVLARDVLKAQWNSKQLDDRADMAQFVLGRRLGDREALGSLNAVAARHASRHVFPKSLLSEQERQIDAYQDKFNRVLGEYLPVEAMLKADAALGYAHTSAGRAASRLAKGRSKKLPVLYDDLVRVDPKGKRALSPEDYVPSRIDNYLWTRILRIFDLCDTSPRRTRNRGRGRPRCLNDRQVMDAVFFKLRTGCSWKGLPGNFGKSSTIYDRYVVWRRSGVMKEVLKLIEE